MFSINGEAFDGTTTTPIPVLFGGRAICRFPRIPFTNDETDGDLTDLQYEGTSYRLAVASNRNVNFDFGPDLSAVSHVNGGTDPARILAENASFWAGDFNDPPPLTAKGDTVTFDIDGLHSALEAQMNADRAGFLGRSALDRVHGAVGRPRRNDGHLSDADLDHFDPTERDCRWERA